MKQLDLFPGPKEESRRARPARLNGETTNKRADRVKDAPTKSAMANNRRRWIRAHFKSDVVQAWLAANPPPRDWKNSKMAWAYQAMPEDLLGV